MGGHSDFKYINQVTECYLQVGTLFYGLLILEATTKTYDLRSPGIYLVLFCICTYILLHRPSSRGNTVLLVTTTVLFTFSTILMVLTLVLVTADIEKLASIPYDNIQNAAYVVYAINKYVYVLSSHPIQKLKWRQFHR
jgi:hypothetical protein